MKYALILITILVAVGCQKRKLNNIAGSYNGTAEQQILFLFKGILSTWLTRNTKSIKKRWNMALIAICHSQIRHALEI
jgi:hypothetical protein